MESCSLGPEDLSEVLSFWIVTCGTRQCETEKPSAYFKSPQPRAGQCDDGCRFQQPVQIPVIGFFECEIWETTDSNRTRSHDKPINTNWKRWSFDYQDLSHPSLFCFSCTFLLCFWYISTGRTLGGSVTWYHHTLAMSSSCGYLCPTRFSWKQTDQQVRQVR